MRRRAFLQTGMAAGIAGATGLGSTPSHIRTTPITAEGPLRLSSNENALGLSPAARRAVIDGIPEANRYPGAKRRELVAALAAKHGVARESIVLGCGSTEVLQVMVQASATRRCALVTANPTFEDVFDYGIPETYRVERVPLDANMAHDIDRMRDLAALSWDPVLVYICNPNNPTGTLTACSDVDSWIEDAPANIRFMIDEAYFEYVDDDGYWSAIKWIEQRPNVVVARTFSKIYGMAGMRLGYGIAHPDTAAHIRRFMCQVNANELALRAALASLEDGGLVGRSLDANTRAKQVVYSCLEELDLEYLPTQTNFVMHRINGDLRTYRERMREHDVWVGRPFPPMLSYNRLSFGLPEEMERFTEVLREFRTKGWV
ncbi:MAG: aminotransferase class I/II-fold pyridoxal phosphate-dependent enzyme [Gemmatimonadota bacterium]|nr:MAG: aminotransferase class I/II-fold pyridoxal phosphate-dependent enzyme [Gemmatimonadota bacterium]